MAKKKVAKKTTSVRQHPLHVTVSKKNPDGLTTRRRHLRHLHGTYLDPSEIEKEFNNYDKKNLIYPDKKKLNQPNSDKYDEIIAVWCDYFSKKFNVELPLNPNVVKALIASESDFRLDPPNPIAIGIAQITPDTLKIFQDPDGEVKDFIFKDIRKKDLKNPSIAIPMAIRWIFRKKRLADGRLGRSANDEEIILEYKGLLKSRTEFKNKALEKYRLEYGKLTKK
jgi:hypothetical protein